MSKFILTLFIASLSFSQLVNFASSIDISKEEYKERRRKLMNKVSDNPMVFIGNTSRNRINDTQYEFRQESNFYYLSGFNEPNAFMILSKKPFLFKGKRINELIFVPENNLRSMTWTGRRLGTKGAKEYLGFENAEASFTGGFRNQTNNFEAFMKELAKEFPKFHLMTPIINAATPKDQRSYFQRYKDDLVESLQQELIDPKPKEIPESKTVEVLNTAILQKAFRELRGVKSKRELELLQRAVDITVSGHHESFKIAKHVHHEYQVEAAIEFAFKFNGAEDIGYNSIVGCGENGTILHYETNRGAIDHEEIFCLDAGAEYKNYTADITRSFPAGGKFTEAQKEIYKIVLDAQSAGAKELVVGSNYGRVDWAITKVIGEGLDDLGIIKFEAVDMKIEDIKKSKRLFMFKLAESIQGEDGEIPAGSSLRPNVFSALDDANKNSVKVYNIAKLKEIYPHGWGHHVGLDVHDAGEYQDFKAGMVWTIEPGIYISDRIRFDIDEKYNNIGIRIEDMYEITADGNRCMSAKLPRDTDEIERYMAKKSNLLLQSKVTK